MVYRPSAETEPQYDGFADPAAAHGWENAYDETRELPAVPGGPDVKAPGHGRGSRRRARPAQGPRVPRQAVVAGGVLVSAGLAIAFTVGLTSGSSGGPGGAEESVRPKTERSMPPADGDAASSAAAEPSQATDPAAGTDESPVARASASGSPADSGNPAPSSPTAPDPSATATTAGPGNTDGRPGRGHGATKGPK
ncbi:hypothetical protein [Streptomyces cadmiisoli]|uniref:hypothetical protein n=1 Tax=Streptomyces cadmiisoli TaxID=2184053 RepID=UPI003D71A4BE